MATQTNYLEEGQKRYNQIRQAENIGIERMKNAGFYDSAGNWTRAYTASDIAAYRATEEAKAKNTLRIATREAREMASQASQRANAISSSADALAHELVNPLANGKILLSPVGTNLYVRNYLLLTPDSNTSNVLNKPSISAPPAQTDSVSTKSSMPIQK